MTKIHPYGNHTLLFLLFLASFCTFAFTGETLNIGKNQQQNNLLTAGNNVVENAEEHLHDRNVDDEQMTLNFYNYGDLKARVDRVRREDGEYKRKMDRDIERQREDRRKPSQSRPNSHHRLRNEGRETHASRQKQGDSSRSPAERSYRRHLGNSGNTRRGHHEEGRVDAESSRGRDHRWSSRGRREHRRKSPSPGERPHQQQSRRPSSSSTRHSGGGRRSSHHRRMSSSSAKEANEQHRHSPCRQIDKICGFGKSQMNVNAMREMHEFGDRYCVAIERFAKGGQGEIYVAYSKRYGKCAAYKLVKLESMPNQGMRASALNESNVINHLRKVNDGRQEGNKLKRIIRVYENEKRGNSIHTIMDLGETDLYTYYKEKMRNLGGSEKIREIECLIAGMLNAMIELHGAGVMHLDFKLENAILMPSEQNANVKSVKIIDFGAARIVPSYFGPSRNINQSVRIVERIYTTIYAAPEYAMMDHVNTKADIWSIGVIIGELMTNEDINVNKIALLEKNGSRLAFPRMPFSRYTNHFYERFAKLRGMLTIYLKNDKNERFWRLALGCLRFESNVRPMALQLLAYMNDWCILGVPSTFAKVMAEKSYSGIGKSNLRRLPMCSDITDVDYAEKVHSRTHSGTSGRPASSSSLNRKSGGGRHTSGLRSKSGGNSSQGKKGIFSFFTF